MAITHKKIRVLFAHDKEDVSYSETFIKMQFEKLPYSIDYYCVYNNLNILFEKKPIQFHTKFNSIWSRIKRKLSKKSFTEHIYDDNLNFIKNKKYDIIIAQYGPTGEYLVDYANELNCPLTVHFHGYDSGRKDVLAQFNNYKRLFSSASAIITVSNKMYDQLKSLGADVKKLHFNCYGIDSAKFSFKTDYSLNQIIAVGRFTDKKAPQITLYSFALVLKKIPDSKLVMAGDGPLYDACLKLAKAMRIDQSVLFLGSKTHEEVQMYMQNSTVFVQHSLVPENGDTEGTPLAILEAMSTGLPVISTRHAGIVDVVKEGVSGFLVGEMEAEEMAEKIIYLLQNKEVCRDFGKEGRQIIESNYTEKRYLSDLTKIIDTLIHTKN